MTYFSVSVGHCDRAQATGVGVVAQPHCKDEQRTFPTSRAWPSAFAGVSAGALDSMLAH
ncbi:MAG: hypothetical protein V8Q84_03265 [Bilophila sp.]